MKISELGLRLRILFLVLISIIPALLLIIHNANEQKRQSEQNAKNDLLHATKITSAEYKQFIDEGRQLLEALSVSDDLKNIDSDKCSEFLALQLPHFPRYLNFSVADINGNIKCSALPYDSPVNISDRLFFNKALDLKGFSVGEYEVGKISKKRTLNFGYPLKDESGNIYGVLYSALDLLWLTSLTSEFQLPDRSAATLIDGKGTILVRHPDNEEWVGRSVKNSNLYRVITEKPEGLSEVQGLDGVYRIYAFTSLRNISGDNSTFSIGLDINEINKPAEKSLVRNLTLMTIIAAIAIIISQIIGQSLVIRNVQKLKELDKLKDEFLSLASHQLRTPLTSIRWNLELLQKKNSGKLTSRQTPFIKKSYKSTLRMIDLVNDLLNISRIESGRLKVDPVPTKLKDLVKSTIDEARPALEDKQIDLKLTFDENLDNVNLDPKLIRQIYLNLLTNSIKFSDPGKSIHIQIKKEGKDIISKIQDHGYGIPKEEHSKVFQKFFRADNAQKLSTDGTGLGLYLVKLIVEAMGGQIWFESILNAGTTFWFKMPTAGIIQKEGETGLV